MRAVGIHTHFFLSFTFLPPPPRACVCVCARTRAGVKEGKRERSPSRPREGGFRGGRKRAGVKEGSRAAGASGSSPAIGVPYAAGNSHRCHLTYFERSDRSGFGARRPACAATLAHVAAGRLESGDGPTTARSATVAGVVGHDGRNSLANPRQREGGLSGTAGRGRPSLGVAMHGWAGMGSVGRGRVRCGMDAPRREGVAGALADCQGKAWRGGARCGADGLDETWNGSDASPSRGGGLGRRFIHGGAWQGLTRRGSAWRGLDRKGMARRFRRAPRERCDGDSGRGGIGRVLACQGEVRCGWDWPGESRCGAHRFAMAAPAA